MEKIMIIAGLDKSLLLFRSELIKQWLALGYEVVAAAPGVAVRDSLQDMGVSYKEIFLNRTGLNPLKDLFLCLTLIRLFRVEKPDYLFLYTVKPIIYGSLAAKFLPRCKVFSMITGLGVVFNGTDTAGRLIKRIVAFLYCLALNHNSKVIFQNPDDITLFLDWKIIDCHKVVMVNGSGVNLEHFTQVPLSDNPPSFLLIARLIREKGILQYIEAARIVKQQYPEVNFKLIGWYFEDNPSAISPKDVEKWQEEGVVEILGETDDVRLYLAETSVYVLPSYYREGTPRTVLEAMAMGRPIITTDAPGCRETVIEGVNGYLVPVKDSTALAKAMIRFIEKPELIEKMGAASRQIAEKKYDVHKVNHEINRVMGLL